MSTLRLVDLNPELSDDALWLECPCCVGEAAHLIRVPFRGDTIAWTRTGASVADLTVSPSVRVLGPGGATKCWHGFITAGEIIACSDSAPLRSPA